MLKKHCINILLIPMIISCAKQTKVTHYLYLFKPIVKTLLFNKTTHYARSHFISPLKRTKINKILDEYNLHISRHLHSFSKRAMSQFDAGGKKWQFEIWIFECPRDILLRWAEITMFIICFLFKKRKKNAYNDMNAVNTKNKVRILIRLSTMDPDEMMWMWWGIFEVGNSLNFM